MYQNYFPVQQQLYYQKDDVSLCSSLGLVLSNIIMTELEDVIIKPLIADGTIKFYSRFVNGILLAMRPENVSQVHNALDRFDKNVRYMNLCVMFELALYGLYV